MACARNKGMGPMMGPHRWVTPVASSVAVHRGVPPWPRRVGGAARPAWQQGGVGEARARGGRVAGKGGSGVRQNCRPARTLQGFGKWAVITSIGLGNVRGVLVDASIVGDLIGAVYTLDHEVRSWKMAFFHGPSSWSNFHGPTS